jgi:hypothetical protein
LEELVFVNRRLQLFLAILIATLSVAGLAALSTWTSFPHVKLIQEERFSIDSYNVEVRVFEIGFDESRGFLFPGSDPSDSVVKFWGFRQTEELVVPIQHPGIHGCNKTTPALQYSCKSEHHSPSLKCDVALLDINFSTSLQLSKPMGNYAFGAAKCLEGNGYLIGFVDIFTKKSNHSNNGAVVGFIKLSE